MFSPDDPALLFKKLVSAELLGRARSLPLTNKARMRSKWNPAAEAIRHWTQIPLVTARLNFRVTGRADKSFDDWACDHLFADGVARRGLSLGCGDGDRELRWARRGVFSKLVGLDLSPERIERGRRAALEAGLADVLDFRVEDVNRLSVSGETFDVILFQHSLHHFNDVERVLAQVRGLLAPRGLLLVDEFIGARRFQWSEEQLALADMILKRLPPHLRRYYFGRGIKSKNLRAGRFLMWLSDPSEAVESDRIEAALDKTFTVAHRFHYGGTISHLVFHDIAQNFVPGNAEADRWVNWVLDAEEKLLALGLLNSDFSCFVCHA